MTETTTIRGALIIPYPSALGPADEPLTIAWPEGHSGAFFKQLRCKRYAA